MAASGCNVRFPHRAIRARVTPMRFKAEIKFALVAVLVVAGWTLSAWQLGWHDQDFTHAQHGKQVSGVAFAVSIWLAVRDRRDRQQGGFIAFGEGFQTGMVVSAIAAFLNGAFIAVYTRVLNPGWLQRAWEWQKAGLVDAGAKDQDLGRPNAIANSSGILIFQLVLEPIGMVIMGMLLTTAIAAVLRRKPEGETADESSR